MPVYEPVVFVKRGMITIDPEARIDSFVKVEGGLGVVIGRYVHIASFCHINVGGGQVIIEEGVGISSGATVGGGSNQMDGEYMSAAAPAELQSVKRVQTVLKRKSFLGMRAVVLAGVTIGEGAVIGAGAVVTKNVPDYEVWAGVPARKIGDRPHD